MRQWKHTTFRRLPNGWPAKIAVRPCAPRALTRIGSTESSATRVKSSPPPVKPSPQGIDRSASPKRPGSCEFRLPMYATPQTERPEAPRFSSRGCCPFPRRSGNRASDWSSQESAHVDTALSPVSEGPAKPSPMWASASAVFSRGAARVCTPRPAAGRLRHWPPSYDHTKPARCRHRQGTGR
jgi:hypothetical protein